jgi:hypothetical protein
MSTHIFGNVFFLCFCFLGNLALAMYVSFAKEHYVECNVYLDIYKPFSPLNLVLIERIQPSDQVIIDHKLRQFRQPILD